MFHEFQKLATARINKDIGYTHSAYLKFWDKVEGPAKKAFFTAIGRDLNFLDSYEVLRKGNNYFIRKPLSSEATSRDLATRAFQKKTNELGGYQSNIDKLQAIIDNGMILLKDNYRFYYGNSK